MSFSLDNQPVFKARDISTLKRRAPSVLGQEGGEDHLPEVGEVIKDRYLIERMIGKGQFGWVFLVRHIWLGRLFAMKVMHPRVAHDKQWVDRFREEARQTSALGHDHIVFVTDFDRCDKLGYFFVMEYIEGVTLSSIIKHSESNLDPLRALKIIFQASDALAVVHEVGVVHRDLKPSNIMVCERDGDDFIKLLDFGISSNVFEVSSSKKLYGTPAYMAPEQTRTMSVDGRADQFALCTILYQMLTGRRPWSIRRWADASLSARINKPVKPVSKLREHMMLNQELDAVIARALSLEPERRWEDMRAFAYALYVAAELESHHNISNQYAALKRSMDGESSFGLAGQPSMVTLMEQDSYVLSDEYEPRNKVPTRAVSAMTFRTNERLLREWSEGNLSQGVAHVHTSRLCGPGELLGVRMVLEEQQLVVMLIGDAATITPDEAMPSTDMQGVTRQVRHSVEVRFDAESMARLGAIVKSLTGEQEILPESMVKMVRPMGLDDMLSTGEAFLISRLTEPMQIQDLRRLFSGLSFELDEVLMKLVHKGFVSVAAPVSVEDLPRGIAFDSDVFGSMRLDDLTSVAGTHDTQDRLEAPRTTGEQRRVTLDHYMYDEDQISHVLELVAFFKRTQNDEAAIETLRRAIEVSPTQGEFYHQLALLYAKGPQGSRRAMRAIQAALELEPTHPEFLRSQDYIRTLYLRDKKRLRAM